MADDKHQTTNATYLLYFGKNDIFHILKKEFLLPGDGIMGLSFFHKFPRYAITQKFINGSYHYTVIESTSQKTQQKSANFN